MIGDAWILNDRNQTLRQLDVDLDEVVTSDIIEDSSDNIDPYYLWFT